MNFHPLPSANTYLHIPLFIWLAVFTLAIAVSLYLFLKSVDKHHRILLTWLFAILFLMFFSTVIGRESIDTISLKLTPFWSIEAIQNGYIETLYEKIYNVIFFIPYGFLLRLYFRRKAFSSTLLVGFITSSLIECLQLITKTGTCEIDDVICNTVGCLIGSLLAVGIVKLFNGEKNDKRIDK